VTPARAVVLDASVLVRAAVQATTQARAWLQSIDDVELDGHVPDLVFAEVASALAQYVRAETMTAADAAAVLDALAALPLRTHPLRELAPAALAHALETGLSVYDCCYAVLAEALDANLVTADRRLAAAVRRAELLD